MHREDDTNYSTTRARGKVRNASKDACCNSGDTIVLWSPIIVKDFGVTGLLNHCVIARLQLKSYRMNAIRIPFVLYNIVCGAHFADRAGLFSLVIFSPSQVLGGPYH